MNSKLSKFVMFVVFASLLVVTIMSAGLFKKHDRYVIFFLNSRTKQEVSEPRYVLRQYIRAPEVHFVEELMLGPMNHDYYDYVKKTTKYNSCFVRGETLYIDLPKKVFTEVEENMSFRLFYDMFIKNIYTNCKKIKSVQMFLDGEPVYEKF
ncbi:MAG: hypothetical protein CR988_01025 [Treponema sp.]|nr:MAG: hypothetical protein CR988_01025 [Treponema sp.]